MEHNFLIRCNRCGWRVTSLGTQGDLDAQGLIEIKKSCKSCGGPRTFRCKKCGNVAKMFRLKGNK